MSTELEMKFKQAEGYRMNVEGSDSKLAGQKDALRISAEKQIVSLLRNSGYGEIKTSESKVNLNDELSGDIKIMAEGYKDNELYAIVFPIEVKESQIQPINMKLAKRAKKSGEKVEIRANERQLCIANLASFELEDDGTDFYKIYHTNVDPSAAIASIAKKEYDSNENKKSILCQALRTEADSRGMDLRFVGNFIAPKINKLANINPEFGWKKEAKDKSGHTITAGMNVVGEFGEGVIENLIQDQECLKAHIRTANGKRIIPTGEVELVVVETKAAKIDDRDIVLQADAVRQYSEAETMKEDKQKDALTNQTERELVQYLRGLSFEGLELGQGTSASLESKRTGYDGTIKINIKAVLNGESKMITVPVTIKKDQRIFPTKNVLIEAFKTSKAIAVESFEKEMNEKIAEIEETERINEEETNAALYSEPIKKEASASQAVPNIYIAPVLTISRANLPEDLEIGDVINIAGSGRYEITSLSENSISREADSGALATLQLLPPAASKEKATSPDYTN